LTATVAQSGDLLSAESLILAVVSGLFGIWYGEIQGGFALEKPIHFADRTTQRDQLKAVFWRRATPLVAVSTAAAAVFLPNSITLLRRVAPLFHGHFPPYDPLAVSIVAVNAGMFLLALYATGLAIALGSRRRDFSRPDKRQAAVS
jgi:hypothetical protein